MSDPEMTYNGCVPNQPEMVGAKGQNASVNK